MAQHAAAPVPALRIVVVEDEPDIGALIEYVLGKEGFEVTVARSGHDALELLARAAPDLVLLDLMLPDMSGLDILAHIRRSQSDGGPRVIVLSARKDEEDRLRGFELGADDYVTKPFSPKELVYRIRTALRHEPAPAEAHKVLRAGPIEIDETTHEVRVSGTPVHLTLTEFRLLADMVANPGRVRTREALMTRVWDYDAGVMSRTVDTHVRRLRSKLGRAAGWIGTVRGVGYRIKDPATD